MLHLHDEERSYEQMAAWKPCDGIFVWGSCMAKTTEKFTLVELLRSALNMRRSRSDNRRSLSTTSCDLNSCPLTSKRRNAAAYWGPCSPRNSCTCRSVAVLLQSSAQAFSRSKALSQMFARGAQAIWLRMDSQKNRKLVEALESLKTSNARSSQTRCLCLPDRADRQFLGRQAEHESRARNLQGRVTVQAMCCDCRSVTLR